MQQTIHIENEIQKPEYNFLYQNEHLAGHIMFLTLGGSHAYGTNVEGSDVDIRGVALPTKREVITGTGFEQVLNHETDTVVYEFRKLISLLSNCNPNTIEMLGCKPEHYTMISEAGKQLLANTDLFLSKKAASSFGGYAAQQLRRLDNKSVRTLSDAEHETHIMNSILSASETFAEKYFEYPEDAIKLYVDKAVNPEMDSEIFMDIQLKHYPLRDYKCMQAEMNSIVKEYARLGKRNTHAITVGKLAKHQMHLIRLFLMGKYILTEGKVKTYCEKDHDLLMDIRNGKYLTEENQPTKEFMEMVDEYEEQFVQAKEHSPLPSKPDYHKIQDFVVSIIEEYVL